MSADPVRGEPGLPEELMARALRLAEKGLCNTEPNPTVGCVLVNGGEIVGEGWTAAAGGPHAERAALAAAADRARGATAYVTLEPCSHQGRTGPCAPALIEAGVARVVCATMDPNPLVSGRGIRMLEAAGIGVETGLLDAAARAINRGYFSRMTRARPWVRAKIAASLDGGTALGNGKSQWITGEKARADVHRWRARSSAVVTGIGTVLADDPALTARVDGPAYPIKQPLRVVVDSALRTPPTARVLDLPGDVVVFTGPATDGAAISAAGARIERVDAAPRCDLGQVVARLGALEINDVLVEAGPGLTGALLDAGLIDELVLYFAPKLLGDAAKGMFTIAELTELDGAVGLEIDDVRMVGGDLRIIARPRSVAGPSMSGQEVGPAPG